MAISRHLGETEDTGRLPVRSKNQL
jgi:hypothetical protein